MAGEVTLLRIRKGAGQHRGDGRAEDAVAQEFQPLVGAGARLLAGERADMGERTLEQGTVAERVAEGGFERIEAGRVAAGHRGVSGSP